MKRIPSLGTKFLAVAITLSIFTSAYAVSAAHSDQGAVKVIRISGAARVSRGNNSWTPLRVGDVLRPGALIQTASHSQVDLVLGDPAAVSRATTGGGLKATQTAKPAQDDVIRMTENTLMAIDKLLVTKTGADVVKETELDLRAGKIEGSVKKLTGASKFEVKIPNGVAGIRGTIFSVSASGVLTVWSGSVVLAIVGPGGAITTKVVNPGEQYDPATGLITPAGIPAPEDLAYIYSFPGEVERLTVYNTPDRTIYFIAPLTGTGAQEPVTEFAPASRK